MKIKTCFFVLTLGLCNLIKGNKIPSLKEVIAQIEECDYFDKKDVKIMCHIQESGSGFWFWQTSFDRLINNIKKISPQDKVKLFELLLALGILQLKHKDDQLNEEIAEQMDNLKQLLEMLEKGKIKKVDLGFNFEDLANELSKRREQIQLRVQIKENESSLEEPIQAKKRKLETNQA